MKTVEYGKTRKNVKPTKCSFNSLHSTSGLEHVFFFFQPFFTAAHEILSLFFWYYLCRQCSMQDHWHLHGELFLFFFQICHKKNSCEYIHESIIIYANTLHLVRVFCFSERKQIYTPITNRVMYDCRLSRRQKKKKIENINNSTRKIINVRVWCKYPFGLVKKIVKTNKFNHRNFVMAIPHTQLFFYNLSFSLLKSMETAFCGILNVL